MKRIPVELAVVWSFFVVGCSAKVVTEDVSKPPIEPGETLNGVPVRLADRQSVTVYAKQPDGTYDAVFSTIHALPDQSRLFVAGVKAEPLSNHTLSITLNADGTAKSIGVTTASQGEAALSQLGSSLATAATATATFEQQRQKAEQSALEQEENLRKAREAGIKDREARVLAYREALEAVMVQQAKAETFQSGSLERLQAESALRVLKLKANQAARALGMATPYPEADELS